MTGRYRSYTSGLSLVTATVSLPLLGAWVARRDLSVIFRFPPPLDIPLHYPRFSWFAVFLVVFPFVALAMWWNLPRPRPRPDSLRAKPAQMPEQPRRWPPWWGIVGVAWTCAWWVLAWTRFGAFAPLQRYTFFPLWFGFILVVNACTFSVSGTCLMIRRPHRWLALFAGSAVFWWVFEWLNRFTQNWHYLNVSDFGARAYILHASLCFSTVLPAVAAVAEFLLSFGGWRRAVQHGPALRLLRGPAAGILIAGGAAGLVGAGALPLRFYPALWSGPLALALGEAIWTDQPGIVKHLRRGDWLMTASWAMAALLCGFLWELWNSHSAAKWVYTVPYVDRWHLFEMPLLGYLGYLPFGVECYVLSAALVGNRPTQMHPSDQDIDAAGSKGP